MATISMLASSSIAGCFDNRSSEKYLLIRNHKVVRSNKGKETESVSVVGIAENISDHNLSYVQIRARFLTSDEMILDWMLDETTNLDSGTEWKFDIIYPELGEDAAKVSEHEVWVEDVRV